MGKRFFAPIKKRIILKMLLIKTFLVRLFATLYFQKSQVSKKIKKIKQNLKFKLKSKNFIDA